MSAQRILRDAQVQAQARVARNLSLLLTPWILVGVALALRWRGTGVAIGVFVVACALAIVFVRRRLERFDVPWVVREVDARRRDLEDSTDLLIAAPEAMSPLERLQRARIEQRIADAPAPDLRPAWSLRTILVGGVVALVCLVAILTWPARQPVTFDTVLARFGVPVAAPTFTRVTEQSLRIEPPVYTRVAARTTDTLDAKAPQGTRLHWTLHLFPQPKGVELVFHDGRRVALVRNGDGWEASDVLTRSALYRIELHDAPPLEKKTLHRLDAIADRAPEVRVLQPDRGLVLMQKGQRRWGLSFEATDDYGVAPTGRLRVTVAHGSGEQVEFRETEQRIGGSGAATARRFATQLDLAALGLTEGDDLIVQLRVEDSNAQSARSASVILRWPPDTGEETTDVNAQVRKVLPAYFRSQRQIIMDAEALLKQKSKMSSDEFVKRSDTIGVDQRILRLRYGQFLGEEAEGDREAPPTNDPASASTSVAHDDDHATAPLGQAQDVVQEFGHTHDEPEAATLLDPETRATLKKALDQMWQSELHLRMGAPNDALPFAYRALGFIKEVQQATRIYLARVGTELPPIDESRRMGGDRAGVSPARDPLAGVAAPDRELVALWRALYDGEDIDFPALERWLGAHQSELHDPLAFVAAVEALRAQPNRSDYRNDLRALLWPLLPRPAANVERREGDDAQSRRYLDALREERAP